MDVRTLRALESGRPPTLLEDRYVKDGILGQGSFGVVWRIKPRFQRPSARGGGDGDNATLSATVSSESINVGRPRRSISTTRHSESTRRHGAGGVSTSQPAQVFVAKELIVSGPTANRTRALAELAAREVRVLARLEHPNVVRYIEQISEPAKTYIIMEYCPGGDLKQLLKKRLADGVFLREKDVLSMFRQLLRAVAYVHSRHLLHRDIKSANIFLSKSGRLKLGDFGLSKEGFGTVDQARTICGTPMYYAPEMCREAPYDALADVWALGCVFYEIVALRHPFAGVSMRDLPRKIISLEMDDPNPGRRYTAELTATVMRCMLCPAPLRLSAAHLLDHPAMQRSDATADVVARLLPAPPPSSATQPPTGAPSSHAATPTPQHPAPQAEIGVASPPPATNPVTVQKMTPGARPGGPRRKPTTLPPPPAPPKRPPPSSDPTFAGREARLRRLLTEARNSIVANVSDTGARRRQLAECDAVIATVQKYVADADGAAPEDSTCRFMHAEQVVTLLGEACDDAVFSDVCIVLGIHGGVDGARRRARSAERSDP